MSGISGDWRFTVEPAGDRKDERRLSLMSESNERAKAPRRHHGPMGGGPGRPVEKQKILKEH